MKIASTQYNLKYKSFEFYISGCIGNCIGCCNPELKNFDIGYAFNVNDFFNRLNESIVEQIWILGGDPIDQKKELLINMIQSLKIFKKPIWIWTRHNISIIDDEILSIIDYIKCGKYDSNLKTDNNIQFGIKLATSNQKIYKL